MAPLVLSRAFGTACVHRDHDRDHDRGDRRPGVHHGGGLPPHAPAHGHRAKLRGHDLEFDSRRGVYGVIGFPGIYWHAGWFFRLQHHRWVRASDGHGPWNDVRWGDVPYGLRGEKHHGKGRGKKDERYR